MASKKSRANAKTQSPIARSNEARKKIGANAGAARATSKTASKANGLSAGARPADPRAVERSTPAREAPPKKASAAKAKNNGPGGAASAATAGRGPTKPKSKSTTRSGEATRSKANRVIHLPQPKARAPKPAPAASASVPKRKPVTSAKAQNPTAMAAALGVAKAVLNVAKAALASSSETKQKSKGKAAVQTSPEASQAASSAEAGGPRIAVGDEAPSFVLRDDSGTLVSSESLRGSAYVLYFYPKDDTPGCTLQACGFRDSLPRFSAKGVRVLGVSADTPETHTRFKKKYGLTFPLLSDPEKTLAKAYGVWTKKINYGREYMGIERSTFHVDRNGKVHGVWRSVRVPGHVDAVLDKV